MWSDALLHGRSCKKRSDFAAAARDQIQPDPHDATIATCLHMKGDMNVVSLTACWQL